MVETLTVGFDIIRSALPQARRLQVPMPEEFQMLRERVQHRATLPKRSQKFVKRDSVNLEK
jgi:hypothetical protein